MPDRQRLDRVGVTIHETADVSDLAEIGAHTRIWHQAQIRERARIGQRCIIGKGVYVDFDVSLGNNVKVQNYSLIYHGTKIGNGVFIGPNVTFTNDRFPRAINLDGSLKGDADWDVGSTIVEDGASVGTGSVILPDVTIGTFALVAAGSVVTKSVPRFGLVMGCPARITGYVCACGRTLDTSTHNILCSTCGTHFTLFPDSGELVPEENK